MNQIEKEGIFFDEVLSELYLINMSPISELYKYFYSYNAVFAPYIEEIIKNSYGLEGLRKLSASTTSWDLTSLVHKRLNEINNAECFIMSCV